MADSPVTITLDLRAFVDAFKLLGESARQAGDVMGETGRRLHETQFAASGRLQDEHAQRLFVACGIAESPRPPKGRGMALSGRIPT